MNVVDRDLTPAAAAGRVVWTGRHDGLLEGGLDGWSCDRASLLARLDDAAELVVLDALSFPWDSLRPVDRDIPLVLALPPECDLATIDEVFGSLVLHELTPFDTVVEARADVRAWLTEAWGLQEDQLLVPSGDDPVHSAVAVLARRSEDRLEVVETELGTFRSQVGDLITAQLREFGAHQRGVLNMLLALVRADDVVVDVGAHIGTVAIPLARSLDDGQVLAVEGHPATAALLERNIVDNGVADRVVVRRCILGADDRAVVRNRLVRGNTGGTSFGRTVRPALGGEATRRLDEVWRDVDMPAPTIVKVDVEGAELDVLTGAEDMLDPLPILVVEVSEVQLNRHGHGLGDVQRWLDERGYTTFASVGERNHDRSEWELAPLDRLADHDEGLFDVVAVPPGCDRVAELGLRGSA